MKKVLGSLFAVCFVFTLVCLLPKGSSLIPTASADYADVYTEGDFTYEELADGTLRLSKYSGTATSLTIPKKAAGKTVTAIGSYSLRPDQSNLKSVVLPSTVTKIEAHAFAQLYNLKSLVCHGAVTTIGYYAFEECTSLSDFDIPKTVTNLDSYAFYGCGSLKSVTIPEGVTAIKDYTFYQCRSLSSITFHKNVKRFEHNAFYNTQWLKNARNKYSSHLVIVNGVLVDAAQYAQKKFTIPDNVTSVAADACADNTTITSLVIPSSVKSLGAYSFLKCSNLTSVSIPSTVTSIGDCAFFATPWLEAQRKKNPIVTVNNIVIDGRNCKGAVTIPSTVKAIADGAFNSNENITSVTVPGSVKSIGCWSFAGCDSLTSVKLSSGLTSIGNDAFRASSALKTINLPSTLNTIGNEAFFMCYALEKIAIPGSVSAIGKEAFRECTSMTSISLPDAAVVLGEGAFSSCSKVTSLTVPAKVKLGNYCFGHMSSVTSLVIASGRTELSPKAFWAMNKLKTVSLPYTLKVINSSAFAYCSSIDYLSIPKSVERIESYAFQYCKALATAKIRNTVKYISDVNVFDNCKNLTIYCTKNSLVDNYARKKEIKTAYSDVSTNRIYGNTRYGTAVKVSEKAYPDGCDVIVIASGTKFADALAGVSFAKILNAPILLSTDSGLDNTTIARIKALQPQKAYILGGEGAVPSIVNIQLAYLGIRYVSRTYGADRYATAVAIGRKIEVVKEAPKTVFIANATAFPDALSASAAAAVNGSAVLYIKPNGKLDTETADYLNSIKSGLTNIYIIGGEKIIPASAVSELKKYCSSVERLGGANRYATSAAVNEKFKSEFTSRTVCVVTGKDFPDALTAGVYAAQTRSALVLADQSLVMETKKFLINKCPNLITAIGGTGAVPNDIISKIVSVVKSDW